MAITSPLQALCLFFVYSFLGWSVEVAFHAVSLGKLVNRGFLNGPVCPIYGFGMLGILTLLAPLENNLFWLFAVCYYLSSSLFALRSLRSYIIGVPTNTDE